MKIINLISFWIQTADIKKCIKWNLFCTHVLRLIEHNIHNILSTNYYIIKREPSNIVCFRASKI